jgi:DNA-binding IclR family transcriptional regulator
MDNYVVPNLSKAIQMLRVLAASEEGLSAAQIEARLEIPRTTAFRILKTLRHEGMVDKQGTSFRAGAGLFEIGLHALSRSHIRERAMPLLQELTAATGQTSHLAVPSGWHSLILEVCDSAGPVRVASRPGTLAELNCSATGKIFLSFIYRQRIGEYLATVALARRTPNTLCDEMSLRAMTEQVCAEQYATDEEEYHPGVRCLAAPVFDMQGDVIAAIGVTGPTVSFPAGDIPFVREQVCRAAQRLSASLGNKQVGA